MNNEALKQALQSLEAVEVLFGHLAKDSTQKTWLDNARAVIPILRSAIAQAEQPVVVPLGYCCYGGLRNRQDCASCAKWIPAPLSASPSPAPAVPDAAKPEQPQGSGERVELIRKLREDAMYHREVAHEWDVNPESTVNWQHAINCDKAAVLLAVDDKAAESESESEYFAKRQQIDCNDRRVVFRAGFAAGRDADDKAGGEVAQWQKRHPSIANGCRCNTNEADAKWWRDNSPGWEARALYTRPQPQAEAVRVPLTEYQIEDMRGEANRGFNIERDDYLKAVRDAESAHGIK